MAWSRLLYIYGSVPLGSQPSSPSLLRFLSNEVDILPPAHTGRSYSGSGHLRR